MCSGAILIIAVVMRRSIMTEKIARRGYHIYREYGVDPLERHFVDEVMTRTVKTIDAAMPVHDALETFFGANQTHRAYPVVRGERLVSVVDRMALMALVEGEAAVKRGTSVGDAIARTTPPVALANETCRLVATRLAVHGLERLPVVADRESLRLIGIVARSDLVKPAQLHFDEEHKKERFRRFAPLRLGKRRTGM